MYDKAYLRLFERLDWLSDRLATRRYLVGAVYRGHFTCNRTRLSELPVLWAYARDLFRTPGFGDTIDFVRRGGTGRSWRGLMIWRTSPH